MLRTLFVITIILFSPFVFATDWPDQNHLKQFIAEMHDRHGFDKEELATLFAHIKPNPVVLRAIAPPSRPDVKSWQRYRLQFLNQRRINWGVHFWNEQQNTLERAEESFGVPAEIIVAIIGVETEYGRNTGKFSVLEALATLAFAYPPRAAFFRSELEELLLLARENHFAPESIKGSFAGALGIPQFMPGSQRKYAIDFDQDGRVDLQRSAQDAIGSVGRFLKLHGWEPGKKIAEPVKVYFSNPESLTSLGIKPIIKKSLLISAGVAEQELPVSEPFSLIDLISPEQETEFWWGYNNFYVLTRYNRSSFYAMSVMQLATSIQNARANFPVKPHRAE